jgi:hypothetical protein
MVVTLSSSGSASRPKPFTVDHFRRYARLMVLDNGDFWEPEDFQLAIVEDIFAGFDEILVTIPEGNGKTTLMSAMRCITAITRRRLRFCWRRRRVIRPVCCSARPPGSLSGRRVCAAVPGV